MIFTQKIKCSKIQQPKRAYLTINVLHLNVMVQIFKFEVTLKWYVDREPFKHVLHYTAWLCDGKHASEQSPFSSFHIRLL